MYGSSDTRNPRHPRPPRETPTRDDANDAKRDGDALARTHGDDDGSYDVKVANVHAKKFNRASFEWWWSRIRFASDA